jgi:NADPH:quinone reductase-like Zn-dependent oxidoreductase
VSPRSCWVSEAVSLRARCSSRNSRERESWSRPEVTRTDDGFNYKTADWVKQVREATEGRGPDLIIDGTGGGTFDKALDAVRPGGTGRHVRRHDPTAPAADGEAHLLETARRPRIDDGRS